MSKTFSNNFICKNQPPRLLEVAFMALPKKMQMLNNSGSFLIRNNKKIFSHFSPLPIFNSAFLKICFLTHKTFATAPWLSWYSVLLKVPGWCNFTDVLWVPIPAPRHKVVGKNHSSAILRTVLRIGKKHSRLLLERPYAAMDRMSGCGAHSLGFNPWGIQMFFPLMHYGGRKQMVTVMINCMVLHLHVGRKLWS